MAQSVNKVAYAVRVAYRTTPISGVGTLGSKDFATSTFSLSGPGWFPEGRLQEALDAECHMFSSGATLGDVTINTGKVEISNPDGALDDMAIYSYDAQTLQVKGFSLDPASTGAAIDLNTTHPFVESGEMDVNVFSLFLRDKNWPLRNPVLQTKYLGNNVLPSGIEGTSELAGVAKPRVVGFVFNASPVFVNTSLLIYQFDGQQGFNTGWSLVMKDMGFVLLPDAAGNYTSQADMEANAPAFGKYRVWPAGGCVRLGSTAGGRVTGDVTNPVQTTGITTITPAVTDNSTIHVVLARLALDAGMVLSAVDGSQLFSAGTPSTMTKVGMYITDGSTTWLDAMNFIAKAESASWLGPTTAFPNTLRVFHCRPMDGSDAGNTATAVWNINAYDVKELRRVTSSNPQKSRPLFRVNVLYAKNWTPMSDSDISGGVFGSTREALKQEWQTSTFTNAAVQTQWPYAQEATIETGLGPTSTTEAARLGNIYMYPRSTYEVDLPAEYLTSYAPVSSGGDNDGTSSEIGQVVNLTYPRFDLANGKLLQIIGKVWKLSEGYFTLILWG